MLQVQPPRFLPLPRGRIAGRRCRVPPTLAIHSKWKLPDVNTDAVRQQVRSWMSLARGAIDDATHAAREKARHKEEPPEGRKKQQRKEVTVEEQALVVVPEVTVERRVDQGWLSLDAVVSIEHFARLNGLTGIKVQRIFKALASQRLQNDARSLVEYSCFRYLSRGSSKKRPVLKWEENIAWPGNLTLTDKALYFEAIGLSGTKKTMRLDLTDQNSSVGKAKVGPFGSKLFDSAVSVSSGSKSDEWTLEFVDFSGEMRRDVWLAFISEIISVYRFIREYGPNDDDPAIHHVYGAHKGKKRAVSSAANSIARLQSLQFIRRLSEDPAKLVHFSYLSNAPFGDIVLQTLAVKFWGGPLVTKLKSANQWSSQWHRSSGDLSNSNAHIFDINGSVYLRKWMTSPSWASSHSIAFWRNSSIKDGVIVSKSLVVADKSLVEKAMVDCKEKSKVVEKTQATIVAATIEGIPSNIDLFKELMLPFVIVAKNFKKLQRWENPRSTICFLLLVHTIIFRNLLSYVFPFTLMVMALSMLALKGLKEQGRLGRSFGKVTIRDQPPSNTIQKIIALKEAMASVENYLQNLNVSLLKIRTIFLAGQSEVTTQVALVLLASSVVLLVVPFKYVLAVFTFDLFTRELEFRREMVRAFMNFLYEQWASIHAAPVVVLPYEGTDSSTKTLPAEASEQSEPRDVQSDSTYVASKNGMSR
ncbi:hypothetical protein PR202_gb04082 [Eleusine coracana subsp. coracana]|uniref:Uncharacterized protein n=1 Tax=Eleusine coracana subsp. coracana TaxID=191504 RepID=A0AAV5E3M0_ELECO|nr:hypothetical protein PR202_gb04082 [Eleusine coracana subsp. coracana]